ncbi:MAG: RsmB/NOP family class I SAM-dependent RNA methyltransferase [Candidatus Hermodarchaeota archaeon]
MKNQEAEQLAQKYGYREFMVERYLALFGADTEQFLKGNDLAIPKTIRVNTLAASPQDVASRLRAKGIKLESVSGLPYAFHVLESPVPVGATTEYLLGYYMLQSPASMWAIEVLDPQPGQLVIDMCAAPGGKTTLIAQLMENQGALLATDISRDRIRSLRSNLSRLRVENTLAVRMDAAQLLGIGIQADAVLLDAPCTGEGLIPVDPSRKQSRSAEDFTILAKVQKKLILAASQLLRVGGVLVYSTCSFAPEENEEIIDFALRQCPVRIVDTELPAGDPGFTEVFGRQLDNSLHRARRFYPYKHQMEGFFICKMVKFA